MEDVKSEYSNDDVKDKLDESEDSKTVALMNLKINQKQIDVK